VPSNSRGGVNDNSSSAGTYKETYILTHIKVDSHPLVR